MKGTNSMENFLWYIWDMIDISENMHRMDRFISRQRNGLPAAIHAFAFLAISIALAAGVWYFDIQSTLVGLSSLTDVIIPSLPAQTAHLTWYIIAAFTLLPTLLEIFTAGLAKEDIKIVQLAIIGFTMFDAVTDIPRAYQFAMQLWPQIQLLGYGISWFVFWIFFIVILFFATLGLEVLMCMFGYLVVCFGWKIFNGEGSYNLPRTSVASKPRKSARRPVSSPNVGFDAEPEVVIIDG